MTASRKSQPKKKTASPGHFFEKELAGENSLTIGTAELLYDLSTHFYVRRPWDILADRELVVLAASGTPDLCYCSVMGALGQVFSLQVYLGGDGYRLFRRIATGDPISAGEFYASQKGVSVEFVPSAELTPPDRALLRAVGHVFRREYVCPVFRAARPGYHPWYITEEEGQVLAQCLDTAIVFVDHLTSQGRIDYWREIDVYPFVTLKNRRGQEPECSVSMVQSLCPSPGPPAPAALDSERLDRIIASAYPVKGVWEADHFYSAAMIGKTYERKACLRMAIAIDSSSGFVFPPALGRPADATGNLMARAILDAIEGVHVVPLGIHVKDDALATILGPLAQKLAISVEVSKSLPALEHAKRSILQAAGDPPQLMGG